MNSSRTVFVAADSVLEGELARQTAGMLVLDALNANYFFLCDILLFVLHIA